MPKRSRGMTICPVMTTTNNKTIEKLARAVTKAERLAEEQRHEDALRLIEDIQAQAAGIAVESAYLHWLKAVLLDTAPPPFSRPEQALVEIQAAISIDHLSVPFRNSRRAILHSLKGLLADPQRSTVDVPRIWALLVDEGEADDESHLALARHHLAVGALDEALKVLTALTILSPSNPRAWTMRVEVAAKLAAPEELAVARAEAAAAGATQVAFVSPPVGKS